MDYVPQATRISLSHATVVEMQDIEMQEAKEANACLVVDTNILMHYVYEVLDDFVATVERLSLPLVVIIPGVVIDELDNLKKQEGKRGWFSRKASLWLSQRVKDRHAVKIQAEAETCEPLGSWRKIREKIKDTMSLDQINDHVILDCCQYFSTRHPTGLLSADRNLCLNATTKGANIHPVSPPLGQWTSRQLAQAVFSGLKVDLSQFQGSISPTPDYKPNSRIAEDYMDVDEEGPVILRVDARKSLHIQIVQYFTALLAELVGRVGAEEISRMQTQKSGLSLSRYAPQWQKNGKHYSLWTASDLLDYLDYKKPRRKTSPPLNVFLRLPYTENGKRGDEFSTQDWITSLGAIKSLAEQWSDNSIEESLLTLEPHLLHIFKQPLISRRPAA